ncbi:multifunctional methyltransferase subunit TRM112-like protein [Phlebotomus argentipes]|uniref:multifunctional methyltransferase subunit TRM112-like protein n=1 Tax=Phlebotomus argentipes TaxID=94469 RepID=UPI002892F2BC|nr:multifunctional methyltransferase subunit TRM112-like protein [Phlebotomus argentipes]
MKLITYNFLTSKFIRGVKVGYPLKLNVVQKEIKNSEYNPEFITRMIPRLDWSGVCFAAEQVGCGGDLPKEFNDQITGDTEILQRLHHILLEIDIIEGNLQCPETGRVFPISNGIPNMLLNEEEV